ncbi:unnamed protein product [Brachionus calyciflorus]|uniref:G-protein coupled receptors family 1 profile domain-containing protein n=1 Tax=Brachionus calyciflorus TaxID=104777 RepID=A0A814A2E2_9BILA|nr:unnamed protein product [Brachionus calyciflorus]
MFLKYCFLIYSYLIKIASLSKCHEAEQKNYHITTQFIITLTLIEINIDVKKSLGEINTNCFCNYLDSSYLIDNIYINSQSNSVLLDNSFYFDNFTYYPQDNYFGNENINIYFTKLNKIDLNSSEIFTFFIDKYSYRYVRVNLYDSIFNGKSCFFSVNNGIFNRLDELTFSYTVKFFKQTCPFIFQNTNLQYLKIYGQSYSFIKHNILGFIDFNQQSIGSKILNLELSFYKAYLSKEILNKLVFENVEKIFINGLVDSLESDLFENFHKVELINFHIENLQYFLSKNNRWLASLNKNNYNNTKIVYIRFDILPVESDYSFPDSDLCFFKDFPHDNFVYPLFKEDIFFLNCSCTLLWLLKNTYLLRNNLKTIDYLTTYITLDTSEPCVSRDEFNKSLEHCKFDMRFKLCESNNFSVKKIKSMLEYVYDFKIILYFIIFVSPILGIIALVSNTFNLIVILNIWHKDEDFRMNRAIFINSIFNILYVFIFLFHMINECVTRQGNFCSSINRSVYSQYFKIYIFFFNGNILKLLSSLSSVSISVNRFILLDNNDKSFFYKIFVKKGHRVTQIFCVFLLGYFMCYFLQIYFTNWVNRSTLVLDELVSYADFPDTSLFVVSYIYDRMGVKKKYSVFVFSLFVINYVINDLIIFLILCSIEGLILLRARNLLRSKIKMMGSSTTSKLKLEKTIDKTTKVILINILFTIMFKAIDFAISTYLVSKRMHNRFSDQNLCYMYNSICSVLTEVNELAFLMSISFNFLIYYNINSNFRKLINKWLNERKLKFLINIKVFCSK